MINNWQQNYHQINTSQVEYEQNVRDNTSYVNDIKGLEEQQHQENIKRNNVQIDGRNNEMQQYQQQLQIESQQFNIDDYQSYVSDMVDGKEDKYKQQKKGKQQYQEEMLVEFARHSYPLVGAVIREEDGRILGGFGYGEVQKPRQERLVVVEKLLGNESNQKKENRIIFGGKSNNNLQNPEQLAKSPNQNFTIKLMSQVSKIIITKSFLPGQPRKNKQQKPTNLADKINSTLQIKQKLRQKQDEKNISPVNQKVEQEIEMEDESSLEEDKEQQRLGRNVNSNRIRKIGVKGINGNHKQYNFQGGNFGNGNTIKTKQIFKKKNKDSLLMKEKNQNISVNSMLSPSQINNPQILITQQNQMFFQQQHPTKHNTKQKHQLPQRQKIPPQQQSNLYNKDPNPHNDFLDPQRKNNLNRRRLRIDRDGKSLVGNNLASSNVNSSNNNKKNVLKRRLRYLAGVKSQEDKDS